MSNEDLVKIELGCGYTKTQGYIGVDRFPLPGVDVVADMEKDLPFPDDYADVVYACHSLEHIENFEHLMEEIYRICKHKALIFVLAPYNHTSLNVSNFYHKTPFNENTFRFFTSNHIAPFPWREYKCEHAKQWGLKGSDNSDCMVEVTTLKIEFFYFQEYRNLSDEEKCNARHAFNDVCDQIYYVLAVNKIGKHFSLNEIEQLREKATQIEPPFINEKRKMEEERIEQRSILMDIQDWMDQKISVANKMLLQEIEENRVVQNGQAQEIQNIQKQLMELNQSFDIAQAESRALQNEIEFLQDTVRSDEQYISQLRVQIEELKASQELMHRHAQDMVAHILEVKASQELMHRHAQDMVAHILEVKASQEFTHRQEQSMAAHILELANKGAHYSKHRFGIYRPTGEELYQGIRMTNPDYIDGLILNGFSKHGYVPLKISNFVPADTYFEYPICGYGRTISFFLLGLPGSKVFTEVVEKGHIISQQVLEVYGDGIYQISVPPICGKAAIRFRCQDNYSMIRTVEVSRRYFLLFSKRDLACFISE